VAQDKDKLPSAGRKGEAARRDAGAVEAFLGEAHRLAPAVPSATAGRLIFALDATMSRQPTWDLATHLQAEMFKATSEVRGLAVQLVYFRGFGECRASRWVADARALTDLMARIDCRGGHTQIGRVLTHVRSRAGEEKVRALVYVGDAMEEPLDDLCAQAGQLGLLGVKAFMFHEGHDPIAANAFKEIARLTGGAYGQFDAGAPQSLGALLRAAAAYASGGIDALTRLAGKERVVAGLLSQVRPAR